MPGKKKLCFVLMPFKDELKAVYHSAIKPACEETGYASLRIDELKGAFNINKKIIHNIFQSDVIIADLTTWNPNVFYEMGVAHAIADKTIMIIQKNEKLPFDIRTYHCIQYMQNDEGLKKLKNRLIEFLNTIDEWSKDTTNPVQDFKPFDAFVPVAKLNELKNQLIEQEKLLRQSVSKEKYTASQKQIEHLKKELQKRPEIERLNSLEAEINDLRNRLAEREKKIKILKAEAGKKREAKIIKPPEGMVHIPVGEFLMGTTDELFEKYVRKFGKDYQKYLEWEKPAHRVWIDDFFIDKYLVTNEQFANFLNAWKSETDEEGNKMIYEHRWGVKKAGSQWEPQKGFENHPIVNVTWFGARQYARWAGKELPTEAQWEKAARGDKGLEYATQNGKINHELANFEQKVGRTTPVGKYPPNPFGLFDMSGNVWEWCLDWFDEKYYETSPEKNPVNLERGKSRVIRGGSWDYNVRGLRCAYRDWCNPTLRYSNGGFRCSRAYL